MTTKRTKGITLAEVKRRKAYKRAVRKSMIVLTVLAAVAGLACLIGKGVMKGAQISVYGREISRLTPSEAAEQVASGFEKQTVRFVEHGKTVYETTVGDMGYGLDRSQLEQDLTALKEGHKNTLLKKNEEIALDLKLVADEDVFWQMFDQSGLGENSERTPSQDAYIKYDEGTQQFVVVDEVQGTEIDGEKLLDYVNEALKKQASEQTIDDTVSLEISDDWYIKPAVTAKSQELLEKLEKKNKKLQRYRQASVTYTFGNTAEELSSSQISDWLVISDQKVSLSREKVEAYVAGLADQYNTFYKPRQFRTSDGTTVTIKPNEYGYQIDQSAEVEQLITEIKQGKTVEREPVYKRVGHGRNGMDDLNGSYIEVSLGKQHLWLYKEGVLITETDIVSGLPTEERATYTGAWPIAYKASPYTLSSDVYGYSTTVQYWMPFVYGQGLHDASWQSQFGGDVYRRKGSHGCINLPPDQAKLIYETIDQGYPILLYE